jgi:ABC-type polysaccharide/polyol phosphate export permease
MAKIINQAVIVVSGLLIVLALCMIWVGVANRHMEWGLSILGIYLGVPLLILAVFAMLGAYLAPRYPKLAGVLQIMSGGVLLIFWYKAFPTLDWLSLSCLSVALLLAAGGMYTLDKHTKK